MEDFLVLCNDRSYFLYFKHSVVGLGLGLLYLYALLLTLGNAVKVLRRPFRVLCVLILRAMTAANYWSIATSSHSSLYGEQLGYTLAVELLTKCRMQ